MTGTAQKAVRVSKYRSKTDIVADMLICIEAGAKGKTEIMYGAHVSFEQLKKYMVNLEGFGLIANTRPPELTTKGISFLKCYREMMSLIGNKREF